VKIQYINVVKYSYKMCKKKNTEKKCAKKNTKKYSIRKL